MNKWLIIGLIAIIAIVIVVVIIMFSSSDEESEDTTDKDKTEDKTADKTGGQQESFTLDEIVVPTTIPVHVDTNNDQYVNPINANVNATEQGTIQELPETYPFRSQIYFGDYTDSNDNTNTITYPSNPDLYPENGVEFRPENSMYIHLENNFLDVGPQIGVGTRVNSHRNGPRLNFRKQYAVPTMPTGYWNQSTISQPMFTNDVC